MTFQAVLGRIFLPLWLEEEPIPRELFVDQLIFP